MPEALTPPRAVVCKGEVHSQRVDFPEPCDTGWREGEGEHPGVSAQAGEACVLIDSRNRAAQGVLPLPRGAGLRLVDTQRLGIDLVDARNALRQLDRPLPFVLAAYYSWRAYHTWGFPERSLASTSW